MARTRTGVFVLGMHRSGTSATTRAINLLGIPLPTDDELIGARRSNPTGFWEVGRLTRYNNRLLGRLGGSSMGPPPLEQGWTGRPDVAGELDHARSEFERAYRTPAFVWKDPRNCILFPFWQQALGGQGVVVLVHRHPHEVARSLSTRQGLSPELGLAVWERYLRSALAGASGLPVRVTPYDELARSPEEWTRGMASFLSEHGLERELAGVDAGAGIAAFVSARPERGDAAEPGSEPVAAELSPAQAELQAALEGLPGSHERFGPPELPPETPMTEALLAERRRADVLRATLEDRVRGLKRELRQERRRARRARSRRTGGRAARLAGRLRGGDRGVASVGRLPDFIVIGGQRCGTTALFRNLAESPRAELARKELHFFDLRFDRGVDWYRSQLAHGQRPLGRLRRRRSVTGEASPYYLFHPLAPTRAREVVPEARLIALLRDPVERAVSHYYHEVGNGSEDLPLEDALEREHERLAGEAERIVADPSYDSFAHRHFSYQARGVYADQLEAWLQLFQREQLLVIGSEQLFERPLEQLRRVHDFIGLADPPRELSVVNKRDYPDIAPAVRERLEQRFAEPNARLRELLGEDLGW